MERTVRPCMDRYGNEFWIYGGYFLSVPRTKVCCDSLFHRLHCGRAWAVSCQRIADTACRDRHRDHRAVCIIVYVTVGVPEICEIRAGHCHAAGILRHTALAVIGIVGNQSDGIVYNRVRSAKMSNTVVSSFSDGKHPLKKRCLHKIF